MEAEIDRVNRPVDAGGRKAQYQRGVVIEPPFLCLDLNGARIGPSSLLATLGGDRQRWCRKARGRRDEHHDDCVRHAGRRAADPGAGTGACGPRIQFGRTFIEPFGWRLIGAVNNAFRQQVLGLPPQSAAENQARRRRMLVVQGYSRHVVPHPRDWPASIHTTGYRFLDEEADWQPPPTLAEFLDAGDPPVYVGFGSMTGRHAQSVTQTTVEALARCGKRGVLQTGWAGLGGDALPSTILCIDAVPHWWLFPRMAAVLHHGGAGTTAEGLRAGIPTVIVPHMADQPFWGARVHALGVGPRPVPRHRLTVRRLTEAIAQATGDAGIAERAASLGALIRAEDGPTVAATLIERLLSNARGSRTDKEAACAGRS